MLSGKKTIECRLSVNRHPAWSVDEGDKLLFKATGGEVVAAALVHQVDRFDNLRPQDIDALAELVAPFTGSPANSLYWRNKRNARFAILLHFTHLHLVEFPRHLTPRSVMSGWVSDFPAGHLARAIEPIQPQLFATR